MADDQAPATGGLPIGLEPSEGEAVHLWFPVEIEVVAAGSADHDAAAEQALARLLRGLESL